MKFKKSCKSLSVILLLVLTTASVSLAFQDNSTNDTQNHEGSFGAGSNSGAGQLRSYYLWIGVIAIIAITFPLSYYLISRNMKRQMEKNVSLISQMVHHKPLTTDSSEEENIKMQYQKILLKFLNYNENRVMKKLIDNNGSILQSEISRMPNMGKVKAHRVLNDMKTKGLVDLEQYGKTNKISLSEDVRRIFIKNGSS